MTAEELTAEQIKRLRFWMETEPYVTPLLAKVMMKTGAKSLEALAEGFPAEFASIYDAVETMETEAPEPKMPWPY